MKIMNRLFLFVLCLIIAQSCAVAQQSANENALNGYMCASASTGVLKSAAMSVKQDGGTFEKLKNGESVLKLSRGDFVEFGFTLPKTASNVKATIKYYADKETPCFIRWNNFNPSENEGKNVNPKKKENLYYKIYDLNNQQRNNVLRVMTEGNAGLKFYNIIITYEYSKPSDNKDSFIVTLDSPDSAKSITDNDRIIFKWTGVGDCPKEGGWITIQFCDNNNGVWKTVPGAEYIDLNGKDWKETSKGKFEGKMEWENHGLTEMPNFEIVFTKGSSPVKKANDLYNEALRLKKQKFEESYKKFKSAYDIIKQVSENFPQNEEYNKLRKSIARELNPFDVEGCKTGDKTSVVVNGNEVFTFVYIKTNVKGFWILNQEVSQAQWAIIVDSKPSKNKGDKFPVENISWDRCNRFCKIFKENWLDKKYGYTKQIVTVSLPTSAQWELAGKQAKSLSDSDIHFNSNILWGAPPTIGVNDKACNGVGIYGMQGNVAEWCLDGKKTPDGKDVKYVRGGSCQDTADKCQINSQQEKEHDKADGFTGFRFVVIPQ